MNKTFSIVTSIILCIFLLGSVCYADETTWEDMTEEEQYNASMEEQAEAVDLSVTEFEFFARVVQAECDGTLDYNDGKLYVAACIWDRVFSPSWPDTVTGVLTQSGQFSTVSGGWCSSKYTTASRWAVIKAKEAVLKGEVPQNVIFFNCISYNGNTPYGVIGDNYFMTVGNPTYFDNACAVALEDGSFRIRETCNLTIIKELELMKHRRGACDIND